MGQYMLSVHHAEMPNPTPEEMEATFAAVDAFNQDLQSQGAWVFAGGLQPVETAQVVRVEDGETLITDGPFAEAREWLGGFWVIETDGLEAAQRWAAQATVACRQPVEVRPFQGA